MYVRKVRLDNLRGFERLDFTFEHPNGFAGWFVITGDNASGKTALLKAIAANLVGPDAIRSLQPSYRGWVRQGQSEAVFAVELKAGDRDRFKTGRPYEQPFWAELQLTDEGGRELRLEQANRYKNKGRGPANGPWAENPDGWFCAGYGPFRRLYGASPEAQRIMSGPSRVARFATMFREDATLGECDLWLRELHHKSLENFDRERVLLGDIKLLLNAQFLENNITIDRVDSDGLWLKQQNGTLLPLADMSEGYRSALAMVVDLLRHFVDVYGSENLVTVTGGLPSVDRSGVVLIDEVDSHLHPEWQRKIGFWFKRIFPKVQFIVTTHSPMICQAADECAIYHLPPPGSDVIAPFQLDAEDYWKIVRSSPDSIFVSPAFGMKDLRSDRAIQARLSFARLRSKASASKLTLSEQEAMKQLDLFVDSRDLSVVDA